MKVKNIMFSGFMAVILMGVAGNASAAVQIASKAYVDGRVDIADTTTVATELEKKADQTYVGTLPEGATATSIVGYIQEKTSGIATEGAMTELSNRVGVAEGKVTALEGKMTTAEGDIDALESAMTGTGEGSVAAKISSAITGLDLANTYETKGEAAKVQDNLDTLSGTVDGISGRVQTLENADYQNAEDVSGAITTAISGLNLANTYEAKGEAAKVQDNLDALSETVAGKAAASDVTALAGRVTTAEGKVTTLEGKMTTAEGEIDTLQSEMDAVEAKAAANETAIAGKQDELTENQLKAVNSGITAELRATYDTAVTQAAAALPAPTAACAQANGNCVLSVIGGNIQWVDITAPLQ